MKSDRHFLWLPEPIEIFQVGENEAWLKHPQHTCHYYTITLYQD